MEKMTGAWLEDARNAVIHLAETIVAATHVLVVKHETRDKKIELAVVVVIEPDGARRPSRRCDAGFVRDVGKRAVAVIVIENVSSITGHVQINPAITIVITRRRAHAEGAARHSGFVGNVGERAVMIIVVKRIFQRRLRRKKIRWP